MDHKEIQAKISAIIEQYKEALPEEWAAFEEQAKAIRESLRNKKGTNKQFETIGGRFIEWPETLYGMIQAKLSAEELKEIFQSPDHKLIRWIAKSYPQLRITQ